MSYPDELILQPGKVCSEADCNMPDGVAYELAPQASIAKRLLSMTARPA